MLVTELIVAFDLLNKESIDDTVIMSEALYPWFADVVSTARNPDKVLFDTDLDWENVSG